MVGNHKLRKQRIVGSRCTNDTIAEEPPPEEALLISLGPPIDTSLCTSRSQIHKAFFDTDKYVIIETTSNPAVVPEPGFGGFRFDVSSS